MPMTVEEFDEWIESEDAQREYYEYLYENYPELNKGGLFAAQENGYDIEGFMDYKGVDYG